MNRRASPDARLGPGRVAGVTLGLVVALGSVPVAAGAVLAVAVDDRYSTPYETRLEVDEPGFLGNDLNVIGSTDPQITNGPDHGELNLHGEDGRFDYTPEDGFSGVDTFTYRLTTLLIGSTSATVRITVGPAPTPKPTPAPTPTPTPAQTPAPTAPPTPAPTPKPTTAPTPRPTATAAGSTPRPTPTARSTSTPGASAGTPSAPAAPTATPNQTADPTTGPSAGPSASATPGSIAAVGATGGSSDPDGPTDGASTGGLDLAAGGSDDGLASGVSIDTGLGLSPTFLVPTLAFMVPGLLLIVAVIAQSVGALAWIPFVRRSLGDDRRTRRQRASPPGRS